jgi:hypothetical protein
VAAARPSTRDSGVSAGLQSINDPSTLPAPHVEEDILSRRAVRRLDDVKVAHLGPGDEPTVVAEDDVGIAPAPPARRLIAEETLEDGTAEETEMRVDLRSRAAGRCQSANTQCGLKIRAYVVLDAADEELGEHLGRLGR